MGTTLTVSIGLVIISSLISGFIGVVVSIIYHKRAEKRQIKLDTLKRFVGYRYDLKSDDFSRAINEIFVVFKDSKSVLSKTKDFHDSASLGQSVLANDKLNEIFKAMCKDLNIDINKDYDDLFLRVFNNKE